VKEQEVDDRFKNPRYVPFIPIKNEKYKFNTSHMSVYTSSPLRKVIKANKLKRPLYRPGQALRQGSADF